MCSKSFFTRLFVSLAYLVLAGVIIAGLTIAIGRIMLFRARTRRVPACLCYVAGRSGGHLIPAMTLAQREREEHENARTLVFTAATQLDLFLMKRYPWVHEHEALDLENRPRGLTPRWLPYLMRFFWVTARSFAMLWQYAPLRVTTTGGYIAIPVCLAAWLLGVPVYLYNLDVEPGAAIGLLSRLATRVIICFTETRALLPPSAPVEIGSYPLRYEESARMSRAAARDKLGLSKLAADAKVLLVIGGSQGSQSINDLLPASVASWVRGHALREKSLREKSLREKSLLVLHQTGGGDSEVERVRAMYDKNGVSARVFSYSDEMELLYQAADLAISRAGAGSLFELTFFRVPAIIIPLETVTTAHQRRNASAIAQEHPALFSVYLQDGGGDFAALLGSRL
ncbi:MAG: UDP-N-acetylglucosamine--N-acetylmuramyl-(pentapeptide) pyrophosphoryl-undecaprenol N-acetylglucosamine transferase [Candidatus Dependentiae bacterium]|nr:UDP-N-acetylglucosamine--N-acetylmuramyl-(pentapeptide) pyrophosphoryl-undecaprenol N-acetylglucosamine transferase [Candidatus Dependentiae bacterium]